MSDPYAETDEWPTPALPAHAATHSLKQVENGSTLTGDAKGAREAQYAEAIGLALATSWVLNEEAHEALTRAAVLAVLPVADEEAAELAAEVKREREWRTLAARDAVGMRAQIDAEVAAAVSEAQARLPHCHDCNFTFTPAGDAQSAREARYAEAMGFDRSWRAMPVAVESVADTMTLADAEQAELRAEVERLRNRLANEHTPCAKSLIALEGRLRKVAELADYWDGLAPGDRHASRLRAVLADPPAAPEAAERCRICGGVDGDHDGATHDARVADMPIPPVSSGEADRVVADLARYTNRSEAEVRRALTEAISAEEPAEGGAGR